MVIGGHDREVSCRMLGPGDREQVVDLVSAAYLELPVYRWLFGDALSYESARWLADIRCGVLESGDAFGAFDASGVLVGVVLLRVPGRSPAPASEEQVAYTKAFVTAHPDFAQRYAAMRDADAAVWSNPEAIDVSLAIVSPNTRNTGVLSALVLEVGDLAEARGESVVLRTNDPALADMYRRKWSLADRGAHAHVAGLAVWTFEVVAADIPAIKAGLRA